ncbi:tRNA (guanosine(46)-N7)-methyltransferase TrmB [Gammaproteobacteria bacterium]|nr:tRNA (guanosine(46)-N7)-methyltransferase TrmB [Gammaproteobacteria bacterium]
MTSAQKQHFKQFFSSQDKIDAAFLQQQSYLGLEIGFGMGDSLIASAKSNPDQYWLGVEVFHAGISAVVQAMARDGIDNIQPLEGDVDQWLQTDLAAVQFDMIRVFFPDPWPKKRHQKRRLVQQEFFNRIVAFLKPGGIFHFASDHIDYAEDVTNLIQAHTEMSLTTAPERPLTKYARKAIANQSVVTDVAAKRVDNVA